jgi:histidinol-phosphate aminotransferase
MPAPWRFVLSTNPAVEAGAAKTLTPRRAVLEMAAYHPPSGGRRNKLRLDFNENTVGAPPPVIDFIQRYLTSADLSMYPEYGNALEDLSVHFGVATDELTLTNGTDEAIHLIVSTFIEEGTEALMLRPSYAMYKFYSQLGAANVQELEYQPGSFAFPLEELLERITPATRAIFISNPNNPTGTGISISAIEKILKKAPLAAVLIDEAYYEFSGITALPLLPRYPNLFVSRTFSKVYGLAAMRCGCLFSQAENMAHVRKAQSPYSVNAVAVMAARIAIQDQKFVEEYVLEVLTARELLYVELERLKIPYTESQANFALMHLGDRCLPVRDKLRERGVLIRDRSYEIPGAVRVTIGTRDQIRRFIEELEKIW